MCPCVLWVRAVCLCQVTAAGDASRAESLMSCDCFSLLEPLKIPGPPASSRDTTILALSFCPSVSYSFDLWGERQPLILVFGVVWICSEGVFASSVLAADQNLHGNEVEERADFKQFQTMAQSL